MVYSLLAAVSVGLAERVPLDRMVSRIADLPPTPERLQALGTPEGALVLLDTFKAAEETVEEALRVLAELPARRRIAVLGDIEEPRGSQGPLYKRLGERLAETADRVIFLGGRKAFASTVSGAAKAGLPRDRFFLAGNDVHRAIALLREELRAGDTVLIKGRSRQRLGRIGLAMAGRSVRCRVVDCTTAPGCASCAMLEKEHVL